MEFQQAPAPDAFQAKIVALEAKTAELERELVRCQLELQQEQSDRLRWEAERIVVEAALRERQALFESVFNQVAIGLNYTDVDGHYLMVNQRYCEILGYSQAELLTKTYQEITHPDDLEQDAQRLNSLLSGEAASFSMQKRVIHKHGHVVWINLTVSRVQDPGSGDHRLLTVVEDITDRKQTEAELWESQRFVQRIAETSPNTIYIYDLEHQCNVYANRAIAQTIGYSPAEFQEMGDRQFELLTHPDDLPRVIAQLSQCQTLQDGEIRNAEYRLRHRNGEWRWMYASYTVFSRNSSGGVKQILGIAQDFTDRKQAELENVQLRERLELVLSMTPAVIFTCKPGGDYGATFITSNVSQVLGYSPEDFVTDSHFWINHVHPEDVSTIAKNLSALFVHGNHQHEYRFLHRDGHYRWVRNDLRLLRNASGKPVEIVGYLADVSDRKTAEIALQQLNQELDRRVQERTAQLNLALSVSRMGIWEWDVQTNLQYWSPENFALFELCQDEMGRVLDTQGRIVSPELTNDVFFGLLHPDDRDKVYQEVQRSLREKTFYECEYRVVLPSGETRWHFTRTLLFFNPQGERIKEFGVTLDITHLKQTETALRQSESLFRHLFKDAPLGIAICSSETGHLFQTNYLFCDMLGYTAAELSEMSFEDITYSEDLPMEQELVAQMLAGERTQYCIEKRFVKKTGEILWAELTATALWDEGENVVYGLGMVRDISDRKRAEVERLQAEQVLQESESRFRQLTENIRGYFWLMSENRRYLYVSSGYETLWGRSVTALYADPTDWLWGVHPEDRDRVAAFDAHCFENGYEIEYRIVRPDGEIRWVRDRAFPICDPQGRVYRMGGVGEDISDRKQADDQIRANLKEKEVLLREIHHRVKNNLQIIVSLLRMQSDRVESSDTLMLFREAQNRVQSMALIHELLYQSADFAQINFREYIQSLVQTLSRTYRINSDQIRVNLKMTDLNLSLDAAIPCGLIINELVSNAFKHAFPGDRPGLINIQLESFASDDATAQQGVLTVGDNGVGIPLDLDWEASDSLGLVIVHSLVTQLRGTVVCDRTEGTQFQIMFPAGG